MPRAHHASDERRNFEFQPPPPERRHPLLRCHLLLRPWLSSVTTLPFLAEGSQ